MRRDRISKLADRRRLYTNETYEQARSLLRPGQPPIPAANCSQQRHFEADLFHQILDSYNDFSALPLGIQRVRPHPDTIELVVENEQRATRLLHTILPSYEPAGEVHGMPGLRIRQRTRKGIEAHIAGRTTSAWLTGQPPAVWKQAESDALESVADSAWKALWRGSEEWSEEERAFEQRWNTGAWERHIQAGAWCSSGLLRRLGVFHTLTSADVVTGYKGLGIRGYEGSGPVRWCLDIIHRTGIPYQKDALVTALTDPLLGLPVTRAHHLDAIYPPHTAENQIRLDDESRTALIELRFTTCNYPQLQVGSCDPEYRTIAEVVQRRFNAATGRPALTVS